MKYIRDKILIIGDIMLDQYVDVRKEYSHAEDTTRLAINSEKNFLGGAGNVADNIVKLDGNVHLISVVGRDNEGTILEELLKKEKISNTLLTDNTRRSTVKTRITCKKETLFRLDREETHRITEEQEKIIINVGLKIINEIDYIVISDYNKGIVTSSLLKKLRLICEQYNIKLLVDPKGNSLNNYKGSYIITPNLKEFNELTNTYSNNWEEAVHHASPLFDEFDIDYIILKDSARGSVLIDKDTYLHFPAFSKEVICAIGAGDSLFAGLVVGLLKDFDINKSFYLANVCSSVSVSMPHTTPVNNEQVNEFLKGIERRDIFDGVRI